LGEPARDSAHLASAIEQAVFSRSDSIRRARSPEVFSAARLIRARASTRWYPNQRCRAMRVAQTRFGLAVGLEGYVQSGAPTEKLGYFCCGFLRLIRLEQKGYAGRMPTLWEASLIIGYPIHLGPVTVTLQAFLYNVFNNQIRTRQSFAYGRGQPPPGYPDTLYDPTLPPEYVNPNYGKIQERQAPRLLRGSIKISF
jgi:hypothetical protein